MATVGYRIQDALLRSVEGGVRWMPEAWADRVGRLLGAFVGRVLRIRRSVVTANLRRAFPDQDSAWIEKTATECYRHLGAEGVVLLRLGGLSTDEILARTDVEGLEYLTTPLAQGKGVIVLTGHLGNWEFGGAAMAVRGIPLDAVAKRQKNPAFNARINQVREQAGMRVVERNRASTRILLASLRAGRAIALVADQNVREGGVFVDFFGTPASTARGPDLLAKRTGAAVVFTTAIREPGTPARYRIRFRPILPGDDGDVLRPYLACLEDDIRAAPAQYLWAHKRWKTRPPPSASQGASERDSESTVPHAGRPSNQEVDA